MSPKSLLITAGVALVVVIAHEKYAGQVGAVKVGR